jgi:hypothetical protein
VLSPADIKNNNRKARNEKLNRQLQNFMYGVIGDDDEAAAKKALAVCTELWRRHVWRDARTVNVIGEGQQCDVGSKQASARCVTYTPRGGGFLLGHTIVYL